MTPVRASQPLVPSVLDRLLDDDPSSSRDTSKTRAQVFRDLKASLRRDLENLLNTRRCRESWPEHLEELSRSLADYGVPDITAAGLSSAERRDAFRRTVEEILRRFEPRFKQVRVDVLENSDPIDRTLRFRIDALLYAEPLPEPVVFDSALQPATGSVEVRENA